MGAEVLAVKGSLAEIRAAAERAERIDAAVLDINLKGEMVYPLVDEILKRQVPVVFATGYAANTIPVIYAGITCCHKPVSAEVLAEAIQQAKRRGAA